MRQAGGAATPPTDVVLRADAPRPGSVAELIGLIQDAADLHRLRHRSPAAESGSDSRATTQNMSLKSKPPGQADADARDVYRVTEDAKRPSSTPARRRHELVGAAHGAWSASTRH